MASAAGVIGDGCVGVGINTTVGRVGVTGPGVGLAGLGIGVGVGGLGVSGGVGVLGGTGVAVGTTGVSVSVGTTGMGVSVGVITLASIVETPASMFAAFASTVEASISIVKALASMDLSCDSSGTLIRLSTR